MENMTFAQSWGMRHPAAQDAVTKYIQFFADTGRLDQAVKLWDEEIPRLESILGSNHGFVLDAMAMRASCFRRQGYLSKAMNAYEQVLSTQESARGKTNALYARCLYNMALIHEDQGEPEEAKALYEESLSIRIQVLGLKHYQTADTAWNLGILVRIWGDWTYALLRLRQAAEISLDLFGPNHKETKLRMQFIKHVEKEQTVGSRSIFDPEAESTSSDKEKKVYSTARGISGRVVASDKHTSSTRNLHTKPLHLTCIYDFLLGRMLGST